MIGEPEVWPYDKDAAADEHEPKGEELAREVLDPQELNEYLRSKGRRG